MLIWIIDWINRVGYYHVFPFVVEWRMVSVCGFTRIDRLDGFVFIHIYLDRSVLLRRYGICYL